MTQKLYQQVGARIRTFRKLARLTQKQLAERAELTVHFLGVIERGHGKPSVDSLQRIAAALGVPIGELFRFPKDERRDTKELLTQITRLLRGRQPNELLAFRNIVQEMLELLPTAKRH